MKVELPLTKCQMATILIVEDNVPNAQLLKAFLQKQGHSIYAAASPAEGITLARMHMPQLILMDMRFPGEMDGWQAITLLKADPALAAIPIIAVAVEVLETDRALEAGCVAYLSKPFDLKTLAEVVQQALDQSQ